MKENKLNLHDSEWKPFRGLFFSKTGTHKYLHRNRIVNMDGLDVWLKNIFEKHEIDFH